MSRLPVIVAQGGISPAGRTSGFHGYHRLVFDQLSQQKQKETLAALAQIRGLDASASANEILAGSLVRKLEGNLFDNNALDYNHPLKAGEGSELILPKRRLPSPMPAGWEVEELADGKHIRVTFSDTQPLMLPSTRAGIVNAAGQLPTGFKPDELYQSRHHPRSLAMTVFGASDAMQSSGLDWLGLKDQLAPEEIAVYAGSAMSQLDYNGYGGMMKARLMGKRVTSKQCPLGFAEMSADFINAYILGSLGNTGTSMGACATLLYNLQMAVNDIRSGKRRLVIVGNSEAPITPEIMDGYSTMGALATDDALRKLEGLATGENPEWRRACRPFADNAGFTIAESSQYFVLMDDELAMASGASILGSVADVFVNADGYKKSISAPGAGNYLTVARAAALGRAILGEESLRQRSFVQAHGTGTPQNRVTESHILNETAKVFGMDSWSIAAVKSYVGHSIGVAAGDQLMSTLGVWHSGLIPGIRTIDGIADDVHHSHLNILQQHQEVTGAMDMSLINAKGFGGNNATALVMSPDVTEKLLSAKHGKQAMTGWKQQAEQVEARQQAHEQLQVSGDASPIYQFGEGVLNEEHLEFTDKALKVPGFGKAVNLDASNPFWEID
ncbi:beta-ketoacyl synthase [Endozoicomonas sp. OPT23]|uniref:beta-ketoacyl synthase n=1 Tax=Endozoicomonas sp. OPT23 TaxID=2072845 RepID=UPI00129B5642|nr:beta-ketoacyl synthase [Endozoicomonas sp. OPT23]MRI34768.1 beta-ketoacyl synthase [Endozoicomonas sp. OPT23]